MVAIATNERTLYRETVQSLLRMRQSPQWDLARREWQFKDLLIAWSPTMPGVDTMREWLVRAALQRKISHILFLDADMTWPDGRDDGHGNHPHLLRQILRHHDKGIVSGVYQLRKFPHWPVAFAGKRWNDAEGCWDYDYAAAQATEATTLQPMDLVGLGCALIPTCIFAKLPQPWFFYQRKTDGLLTVTEDVGFCQQAAAAGVPIWLDPTIQCGHVAQHEVTEAWFHRALFDLEMIKAREDGTTDPPDPASVFSVATPGGIA